MTLWQITATLDTNVPAQSTDLTALRNAANQIKNYSQVQNPGQASQWVVSFVLDDTVPAQANILATVYTRLATLPNVSISTTPR